MQYLRLIALAACGSLFACSGGVKHPEGGGKNTVEYCKGFDNCMACGSQPGCGFCAAVAEGEPVCQPGITGDDRPITCTDKLVIGNSGCPAPPPPAAQ